jgi:hypothetical protein
VLAAGDNKFVPRGLAKTAGVNNCGPAIVRAGPVRVPGLVAVVSKFVPHAPAKTAAVNKFVPHALAKTAGVSSSGRAMAPDRFAQTIGPAALVIVGLTSPTDQSSAAVIVRGVPVPAPEVTRGRPGMAVANTPGIRITMGGGTTTIITITGTTIGTIVGTTTMSTIITTIGITAVGTATGRITRTRRPMWA